MLAETEVCCATFYRWKPQVSCVLIRDFDRIEPSVEPGSTLEFVEGKQRHKTETVLI